MSASSFAYLLDYSAFKRKIAPALEELLSGSSLQLQRIAIESVKNNPEIWGFIDLSRIYFYDLDFKKEMDSVINGGVLLWLLLIISDCCSEFSYNVINFEMLRKIGLEEKSLGDLLVRVAPKINPTDYVDGDFNINHCPIYWLDITDIEKIKAVMQTNIQQTAIPSKDSFLSMLNNALVAQKVVIVGFWIGM